MGKKCIKQILCVGSTIFFLMGLSGCASIGHENRNGKVLALEVDPAEQEHVKTDLGVALSGGGIRSALFNAGLLKWLYDEQVLDHVEILSSVSGGSYTAYWIYADQHRNPDVPRFGFNSFDQSRFGSSVCNIITTSNFVSYPAMLYAAVNPFITFPELYEGQLTRTFGQSDPTGTWSVADFSSDMKKGPGTPYWVINTTFVNPYAENGWAEGLMEFTPLQKGNATYGYSKWATGQDLPVVKAVAISGAAVRAFLNQQIPNVVDGMAQQHIRLSDGGHSENLGAIALIRRGVKNVIIGDAEHDATYKFDAYRNLKKRLKKWDLSLEVAQLDEYLENRPSDGSARHGMYQGVVKDSSGKVTTKIFYLKMARPEAVEQIVTQNLQDMSGSDISRRYFERLRATAGPATLLNPDGVWDCKQAMPISREEMNNWFRYAMASQYQAAQRSWRLKLTRFIKIFGVYSDFPMHSTGDQSYYLNQSMAYVGLGYTEAEFLRPHIDELRKH